MTGTSENARQWVHIGSVGFAFLLRYLTWWQAAALAVAALVFNLFVLPRVGGRRLYRPVDEARGYPLGIVLYPLAVLLAILAFPSRPDIAAAAGASWRSATDSRRSSDGASGGPQWPWNREKTVAGTLAFARRGGAGAVALALVDARRRSSPEPPLLFARHRAGGGRDRAALVETIPVRLDDNVSVADRRGAPSSGSRAR